MCDVDSLKHASVQRPIRKPVSWECYSQPQRMDDILVGQRLVLFLNIVEVKDVRKVPK